MTVATKVPEELIAGDTWQWTRELLGYPASSWSATVYFENAGASFSAPAVAAGDTHSFTVGAAETADYRPGRYGWRLRVTDGTTVTTVESGFSEVLVDPAAAGNHDTRSWARRTLEAVEAFLEGNATTAQQAMSVGGRQISRWSLAELTQWRKDLRNEVKMEEQGSRAGLGRNIKVRFDRA